MTKHEIIQCFSSNLNNFGISIFKRCQNWRQYIFYQIRVYLNIHNITFSKSLIVYDIQEKPDIAAFLR